MFTTIKSIMKIALGYLYCNINLFLLRRDKELIGRYSTLGYIRDYSIKNFIKLKKYNDTINIERLRNKSVIKIGFVVYTSSIWNVDQLYGLIKNNSHFTTNIVVARKGMFNKKAEEDEYLKTKKFFQEKGYDVVEASKTDIGKYDILFYMMHGYLTDKKVDLNNIKLDTIVLHSSYSYMLTGNMSKLLTLLYHVSYRYYADSEYYRRIISETDCYTDNALYLGYPKMDQFYISEEKEYIKNKKVIIYAPHHSVNYTKFKSATFEDNYLAILEIAKKYSETTYWIYKPHPLLRNGAVKARVFNTLEEYDEYEQKWDSLTNAEVVSTGEYYSIFKASDAMITDSVSFLAEYQFTKKPLLLLESGKEVYNDFGNSIVEILYKCPGNHIEYIESFINQVINGEDEMQDKRKEFFENNLYYMKDGLSANYRIYEDILEFCNKRKMSDAK